MEDQGIMALPQVGMQAPTTAPTQYPMGEAAIAAFEQARSQMDPREFGNELLTSAEQMDPAAVQEFRSALQSLNLPPEIIDALNQMVDTILAEPQKYEEIRANFIAEGVPEDFLPAQFDPNFFGALNVALDQMTGASMPMSTQQYASGGIVTLKPIAKLLAAQGRNGDTMLAHITPTEARILRRRGGAGTINPITGLPEFFLKSVFKAVGNTFKSVGKAISGAVKGIASAVKKFTSSTVGKIVTTIALGFFLGPAAASMLGVTSAAGVAAVSGFIGGAGSTLLSGGKLKDALKAGAIGGLTAGALSGVSGGMGAFEAGSYTGPTTVAGQVESFTNGLKSLGGVPTSAAGTSPTTIDQLNASVDSIDKVTGAPFKEGYVPGASDVRAMPQGGFSTPIQPPEFVATNSPGMQVASAGPVSGVGPVPGTPAAQTPAEFMRAAEFRNFGQAPADVQYMRIGDVDTGGGLGMVDRAIPTGGPTPEQVVGMPTPRGSVALGPEPKSFIDKTIDYFSPSAREAAGAQRAADAFDQTYQRVYEKTIGLQGQTPATASKAALDAANAAQKAATPGIFSTYAPVVGLGMGAAYLGGAFDPRKEPPPNIVPRTTGFDLYNQNPAEYGVTPGGAAPVYAPPSITPGYGMTTYAGTPSGYGTMGNLFAAPQFRVRNPMEYLSQYGIAALAPRRFNMGGFASGGIGALNRKYPRRTGPISGPGTETSDSIPAMLSDGEFVMTARAVRGAGGGSRREGAKRMYQMMRKFERNA